MGAVAEICHRQDRPPVERGNRCLEPGAHRERRARMARAVHRLCKDRVRLAIRRLDDYVESLGKRDAQLIHRDRLHGLPVGGHDRHAQPRDADVEVAHRRTVDEAQTHALARPEETGPVSGRRRAVDEIRVGRAAHVGEIGGIHPHRAPGAPVGERGREPEHARIAQEIACRAPFLVVVVGLLAKPGEHPVRILVGPVGQENDVVTLRSDRVRATRIDDQRAIEPSLLLQHGVAVIPVRAALTDGKAILEGLARANSVKAQARHAVHVRGQQDAVPVDRADLGERVPHADRHRVALAPAQHGPGQRPVHRDRAARAPGKVGRRFADREVEFAAAHDERLFGPGERPGGRAPQAETRDGAARDEPPDEFPARARASRVPVRKRPRCPASSRP